MVWGYKWQRYATTPEIENPICAVGKTQLLTKHFGFLGSLLVHHAVGHSRIKPKVNYDPPYVNNHKIKDSKKHAIDGLKKTTKQSTELFCLFNKMRKQWNSWPEWRLACK